MTTMTPSVCIDDTTVDFSTVSLVTLFRLRDVYLSGVRFCWNHREEPAHRQSLVLLIQRIRRIDAQISPRLADELTK